jgi:hypothetical protein
MDCRVKPGNDVEGAIRQQWVTFCVIPGTAEGRSPESIFPIDTL